MESQVDAGREEKDQEVWESGDNRTGEMKCCFIFTSRSLFELQCHLLPQWLHPLHIYLHNKQSALWYRTSNQPVVVSHTDTFPLAHHQFPLFLLSFFVSSLYLTSHNTSMQGA